MISSISGILILYYCGWPLNNIIYYVFASVKPTLKHGFVPTYFVMTWLCVVTILPFFSADTVAATITCERSE